MNSIDEIFNVEAESWIDALEPYQKAVIIQLHKRNQDYEEVAKEWLNSSIPTNVPFGTHGKSSIYFGKVLDEVEAFFSGDEKYKDSRLAIMKESGAVQNYIVGIIPAAIGHFLGTAGVFLAPVIAIVLFTITKIGINAWLAKRKEERELNQHIK